MDSVGELQRSVDVASVEFKMKIGVGKTKVRREDEEVEVICTFNDEVCAHI